MAKLYTKNTWTDEVLSGAERYNILENGGGAYKANMQINLATGVATAGSPVNASRMNNIEDGVDLIDTRLSSGWQSVSQTWTAASSDDPVYQIYVSGDVTANVDYKLGNKIAVTISGADRYGFIVKVGAYDAGNTRTPVDIYGGSDYDITGTMTNPRISKVKSPDGFPLSPSKWTVSLSDTSLRSQASPTTNTWYNLGSLSLTIPIGVWNVAYQVAVGQDRVSAGYCSTYTCLSTSSSSKSAAICEAYFYIGQVVIAVGQVSKSEQVSLTSKVTYYPVAMSDVASTADLYFYNDKAKMIIYAVCAYL